MPITFVATQSQIITELFYIGKILEPGCSEFNTLMELHMETATLILFEYKYKTNDPEITRRRFIVSTNLYFRLILQRRDDK